MFPELLFFLALLILFVIHLKRKTQLRALVLVLGDLGHSPRMQNHVVSLLQLGYQVEWVGYAGSSISNSLQNHKNLRISYMTPAKKITTSKRVFYVFWAIMRIMHQLFQLFYILIKGPCPHVILCQTPPAIPTLAVVQCVRFLRSTRFIIDWHNFGYSIMALNLGKQSKMVQLAL